MYELICGMARIGIGLKATACYSLHAHIIMCLGSMHKNCMDFFFFFWLSIGSSTSRKNWLHKNGQRAILQLHYCLLNKNSYNHTVHLNGAISIVYYYTLNVPTMPTGLSIFMWTMCAHPTNEKINNNKVIHSSNHFYRRSEIRCRSQTMANLH